uniref:hypothetical protein n=1 Tax=Methylobacterium sp. B34 TaxID=95563 RepID=UPI000348E420|nr:hypothetical protein [Methylobacterium sp. B34]
MTLDDLDLPATVRADLERIAEELGMSDDILLDHILETYAPAEGDDHERALEGIQALIKAHADGTNEGIL